MKKILFLDFDGVLFDTLREVYIVNRYLFSGVDFLSEINEKNYEKFSNFKYLVYNIWMFYYYNPIIFSDNKDVENRFFEKLKNRSSEAEARFCADFISTRNKLVQNHYNFWQNLEKPYQFFFEVKKLYEKTDTKIVVVSKKNKQAILQRFSTYDFKFNPDDVFAREILDNYQTKGEFIKEYMDKFNFEQALFVDDNSNNLNSIIEKDRVFSLLALWGNPQPNIKGFREPEGIKKIQEFCLET